MNAATFSSVTSEQVQPQIRNEKDTILFWEQQNASKHSLGDKEDSKIRRKSLGDNIARTKVKALVFPLGKQTTSSNQYISN